MKITSVPVQIVVAVILGVLLGALIPGDQLAGLSDVGKLVIHWVKLVAGPVLFLTVLASLLQVQMSWGHGLRLVVIAVGNTLMALTFGIILALLFFKGGEPITLAAVNGKPVTPPAGVSLGFEGWIKTFMPQSFLDPFVHNDILLIALIGLALGVAIRKSGQYSEGELLRFSEFLEKARAVLGVFLHGLIRLIPFAIFFVIAATVAQNGFGVFAQLTKFVAVVLFAFALQVVFVYGTWIVLVAKYRPKDFWTAARIPVLYALGVNSSLATLPLTLTALKKLNVSDRSAALGAGVATNLNNDGIILYEAMAVFFIAFSMGIPMEPTQMVAAALTCVVAAMGITGIPEAGFISLTVVVGVLKLPVEILPLLLAVDWMIARFRSAVNVLSDMTLSIAMDATEKRINS